MGRLFAVMTWAYHAELGQVQNGTCVPPYLSTLRFYSRLNIMSPLSFLIRNASQFMFGFAQIAFYNSVASAGSPASCPSPGLSCQTTPANVDTCCFNTPGGQLLQTQFWDTSPPTGPSNSWTVHGLWPDHCDGTYDANCDASRAYTNISEIILAAGRQPLLDYMNVYWKDYQGDDETFWEHEWAKHGTCISTLKPDCYTGYTPQQEVVDYFQKAVDLFKGLDTYSVGFACCESLLSDINIAHRRWPQLGLHHPPARLIVLLRYKLLSRRSTATT